MILILKLRLIRILIPSILFFSGCTLFDRDHPNLPHSELRDNSSEDINFHVSGRIFFKHPEGNHSGEMTIDMNHNSNFRLSIFAPLVGTLIYELRSSPKKFLMLNFQENLYILADNTKAFRKTWLGMDISMFELKWLIIGDFPIGMPTLSYKRISSKEYRINHGSSELIIHLNSLGKIEIMKKISDGFLEYIAEIPTYRKNLNTYSPRKIIVKDFSENTHWKIIISEVKISLGDQNSIDFTPPKNMKGFFRNQK